MKKLVQPEYYKRFMDLRLGEDRHVSYRLRHDLVGTYSWAVPAIHELVVIRDLGPIVEIGAGNGYWAHELEKIGTDVVAYDIAPPDERSVRTTWHDPGKTWTTVIRASAEVAAEHSDRTLFLCWPSYNHPMALDALEAYQGDTVIYIGEDDGGCTGCQEFHKKLHFEWACQEVYDLPQYHGLHDCMYVYKRNPPGVSCKCRGWCYFKEK